MTFIDLEIPGNPAALYDLANWLDANPSKITNELHKSLGKLKNDSGSYWLGDSGEAFRDSVKVVEDAMDPVDIYSKDAGEVFRAFAGRIVRGREKFADYAANARDKGLIVSDNKITVPPPPPVYASPAGSPPPSPWLVDGTCVKAWEPGGWQKAYEFFQKTAKDVGNWWGELDNWIDDHIVPLINRATEFDRLAQVNSALLLGNSLARGTLLNAQGYKWKEQLSRTEIDAAKAKDDAETHRKRLRSGNPAISAAADAQTKPELLAARKVLDTEVRNLKLGTRALPVVGFAIDVTLAGVDVVNGGSISSNAVEVGMATAGGFATGAGAAAGAAAIGVTGAWVPLAVGAAAIAGAVAIGKGSVWVYESSTTLDWREALDAGDWDYVFGGN